MPGQIGRQIGQGQTASRTRLELTGKVICRGKISSGTVTDLSGEGITFRLAYDIGATLGQSVAIDSVELGRLTGIVQWARGDSIGVRLSTSSNTSAKIASYFKFFR